MEPILAAMISQPGPLIIGMTLVPVVVFIYLMREMKKRNR